MIESPRPPTLVARWVWLFPATYLVHIAEEYWAGEQFFNWFSRVAEASLTANEFLGLNGVGLVAMTLATGVAAKRQYAVVVLVLSTVVLINAVLHAALSLLTRSYSPGAVSGMVLWLPLALIAIRRHHPHVPPARKIAAVVIGIAVHTLVTALALG